MNNLLAPKLGVEPMSIIVFKKESEDTLLIAADRQFTGEGIRESRIKLRRIPNQQIAWSSDGNAAIGLDKFGDWASLYDFTQKDWLHFIKDCMGKLNELNNAQRQSTVASGASGFIKDNDITASIMIVGWLNDKMGAYELTRDGQPLDILKYNFNAIGSGGNFAYVSRTTIKKCGVELECPDEIRIVLKSITAHVDNCLDPIDIWRITKESIEDVMEKQSKEKSISKKQYHSMLHKASQPIKKSEKGKS